MAQDEDIATVLNTVIFLRMAVHEMRRIASESSTETEISYRLRHMADQCEAEIADLEQRFGLPRVG
jgi:hypothetical protein